MSKLRIIYLVLLLSLFFGRPNQVLGNTLKSSSFFTQTIQQLKTVAYKQTNTLNNSTNATINNCEETIVFIARDGGQIEEFNITNGTGSIATTSPYTSSNLNSLAANPDASIVYYARDKNVYYWEPATDNHGQLVDLSGVIGSNESFSSGGGAYYDGYVYMGAEDNITSNSPTIYRIPVAANGMSTSGSTVKLEVPISNWSSWGDMIVTEEKGHTVIYGGLGAGSVNNYQSIYFKYYVDLDIYSMVSRDLPNEAQLAVDVHGDMWVVGANLTSLQKINRKTGIRYGNIVTMSGAIWDMTGPFNCIQKVEICGNGIDDDGDGLIDNADDECKTLARRGTDCNKNIPASGSTNHLITSVINIPENGIIEDLNIVSLDVTHDYIDDLKIYLVGPDGTSVLVMDKPCSGEDDIFVTLDDESTLVNFPTCPPTDGRNYQPSNPLSAFDGKDIQGDWTLRIEDIYPSADGGTFNCWGLEFVAEHVPAITPPTTEICGNNIDDDNDGLTDCDDPDCNNNLSVTVNLMDAIICDNESTTLSATATGGDGNYTFSWDNGLPNGINHTINPSTTMTYEVMVTDGNGCTAAEQITLTVDGCDTPEICDNGIDDDGDGLIDCYDPDCASSGTAIAVTSQTGVVNPTNALGGANGNFASIYDLSDRLILDFGVEIPAGRDYEVIWRRKSTYTSGGTADIKIEESANGSTWTTHPSNLSTSSMSSFMTSTVTANITTRYIRISTVTNTGDDADIDGVTYSCNQVSLEICDNNIDDDGDGLVDSEDPDCINCPTGSISFERFSNISGKSIADLTGSANYPNSPAETGMFTNLEGPSSYSDNYGTRVRGFLHPTETGNYLFTVTSDDASEVYLSTDDSPNNKVKIAEVTGWTGPTDFTKFPSQVSYAVALTVGERYYIEILHKEGSGGDNLALYWQTPSNNTRTVIDGAYLSPWDCDSSPEICGDNIDNDNDGNIDGADPDCAPPSSSCDYHSGFSNNTDSYTFSSDFYGVGVDATANLRFTGLADGSTFWTQAGAIVKVIQTTSGVDHSSDGDGYFIYSEGDDACMRLPVGRLNTGCTYTISFDVASWNPSGSSPVDVGVALDIGNSNETIFDVYGSTPAGCTSFNNYYNDIGDNESCSIPSGNGMNAYFIDAGWGDITNGTAGDLSSGNTLNWRRITYTFTSKDNSTIYLTKLGGGVNSGITFDNLCLVKESCAEICGDNIDNDNDGFTDCADPDCGAPLIIDATPTNPTNCPAANNGTIVINATGDNLEYSIDGGATYQSSNIFNNLTAGNYAIYVINTLTGCEDNLPSSSVTLNAPGCTEICDDNIDNDGDGQVDCADGDCGQPIVTSVDLNDPTCPVMNNGSIVINATGSNLEYSIETTANYQSSNTFSNLVGGQYVVRVRNSVTGCEVIYSGGSKPWVALTSPTSCSEICDNGIDDDGDGDIDNCDSDCNPYDLTETVFIDGYTQAGSVEGTNNAIPTLKININGENLPADGAIFQTTADANKLAGMAISGNDASATSYGVNIQSANNEVVGNFIGVETDGATAFSNGTGILVNGSNNKIGGPNGADAGGIAIDLASGNAGDAVTENDENDADNGANNLLNFPEL